MRQTSRFKYERVHHDSRIRASVSHTTADLLAPVTPRAASTHGRGRGRRGMGRGGVLCVPGRGGGHGARRVRPRRAVRRCRRTAEPPAAGRQNRLRSDGPGAMEPGPESCGSGSSLSVRAPDRQASDGIDRSRGGGGGGEQVAPGSRLRRLDLRQAERGRSLPAVPAKGGVGGADLQAGGPAGAGRAAAVDARALSCTTAARRWITKTLPNARG